jgi:hypothetical protein
MLTDLDDSSRIMGMCTEPRLSPREWYESGERGPQGEFSEGFRNHVIFPGGMILGDSGSGSVTGTYDELRWGTSLDSITVIPEPGTLALVGLSLLALVLFRRRK